MATTEPAPATGLQPRPAQIVLRPNRSLSWRQSMLFLGAVAAPLAVVSVTLASQGYWLVLPFAGLEIAAVYAGIYVVAQASRRCEVISIGSASVVVEKGRDRGRGDGKGGPEQRIEFARDWVRIELSDGSGRHGRRLWIGASGRRVEVGSFLVDGDKQRLAAELRRLLSI